MRYLVTGGLGVIGSSAATELLEAGHDVLVVDSAGEPRNHWLAERMQVQWGRRLEIIKQRVEHVDWSHLAHTGIDFILHAAASTGIPHSAKEPNDDWVSNVDATRALLEGLRSIRNEGDHVPPTVCLSSVKPYRTTNMPETGFDESTVLEPDEPYAASKMAQSALVMAYARSFDLPVTVFRCSNLWGSAPCHGPRHGWLTWFCISAAIGRPIEIQGSGMQVRDMLWSSDVTSAVLAGFEHMPACQGQVFNVGGGRKNAVSVNGASDMISAMTPIVERSAPGRKHEDSIFITDHSKFTKVTGWTPKVGVGEGIGRVLDWAKANKADLARLYEGV